MPPREVREGWIWKDTFQKDKREKGTGAFAEREGGTQALAGSSPPRAQLTVQHSLWGAPMGAC